MKKYIIPTEWSVCSSIEIEAESLDEAISKVENSDYNDKDEIKNAEYIEDSWTIQYDFISSEYYKED